MQRSTLIMPLAAFTLLCFLTAEVFANQKHRASKPRTGMTKQEIQSVTSYAPDVQRARSRVTRTKRAMNDLADNIATNERNGGDLMKQPGTRRLITNAINAHGEAVQAETQTVKTTIASFMRINNVVEIPREPTTPPPPLPPPRPAAGGGQLQPPAPTRTATRRDMRPAGQTSERRVRFKSPKF